MATLFGRFEIQNEISRSETALIYKAMDNQTSQVVALKTQSLGPLGKRADAFVDTLITEGESTRDLVSQNIVALYGAGEVDGQFCAAMEYIQGNSVATMLARKEGFSIWDLLDITRQICAGLEHAAAKNVIHCSLEPAKILVQWDGMVKILGYGISNMSLIEAESGKHLGRLMPYCSPEQIRGEPVDLRSNLFTLGAILYEMVAVRKAFDAADPVALVNQIQHEMPPDPTAVNSKIQPAVSALIIKALAKDPAERYQSATELMVDLEKCKENGKKGATESQPAATEANVAANPAVVAAAAGKFASAPSRGTTPTASAVPVSSGSAKQGAAVASAASAPGLSSSAAAGADSGISTKVMNANLAAGASSPNTDMKAAVKAGGRRLGEFGVSEAEFQAARAAVLSAPPPPVVEQEGERRSSPRVTFDPMMAEPATGAVSQKFSDLAEMPPLKEIVPMAPTPEAAEAPPVAQIYPRVEEKPKVQPREVAGKAFRQIVTLPPRLILYSILGALGIILIVAAAVFFHVRSEDDQSTAAPRPTKASSQNSGSPAPTPAIQAPVAPRGQRSIAPVAQPAANGKLRQGRKINPKSNLRAPAPVLDAVVYPGQALIDSTPQGAQFQIDGKSDPSWVTPFSLMDLAPGKHIVSVSKAGYSSEIRSVDVVSGSKASLVLHLSPMNALMVVNSTPAGAEVIVDGKPIGRVTPVQFAIEKGSHTVLLRKQGYLDETVTADLSPAQNFQYSPQLRALGDASEMRTVGKLNKLFGHGGESTAGMGSISVHTQPKGAQVAVNQRVLEKLSPVDVMLGPGNYVVDVTLTGFRPIHKVVTVDKGGKVAIDEVLARN
jgi:serine/threonine-protein kinase